MTALRSIRNMLDRLLEGFVAFVMAALVLDVLWQVFTRFILRNPSSWTEELATFLLIWVGLLGACVALNRGSHLGIDYFVLKLSPKKKLVTEILAFSGIALFAALVLVYGGSILVIRILALEQVSPALGIKMGYVYLALPISGSFLVLYSLDFLIQRINRLRQQEVPD